MNTVTKMGIFLVIALVIGAGVIIYLSRPVVELANESNSGNEITSDDQQSMEDNDDNSMTSDDQNNNDDNESDQESAYSSSSTTITANPGNNSFLMSEVEAHATSEDCWAAIDGNVYELTDWVTRHPGGPAKIISLCGTDGTEMFTTVHGKNNKALMALELLKIGSLKK